MPLGRLATVLAILAASVCGGLLLCAAVLWATNTLFGGPEPTLVNSVALYLLVVVGIAGTWASKRESW